MKLAGVGWSVVGLSGGVVIGWSWLECSWLEWRSIEVGWRSEVGWSSEVGRISEVGWSVIGWSVVGFFSASSRAFFAVPAAMASSAALRINNDDEAAICSDGILDSMVGGVENDVENGLQ